MFVLSLFRRRLHVCRCTRVPCRKATREELELVHTKQFVDQILERELDKASVRDLRQYAAQWNSVYLNQDTPDCALLSAGGTVAITEEVNQWDVACRLCCAPALRRAACYFALAVTCFVD